jgi:hypothetical protein
MPIDEKLTEFAGLPIADYDPEVGLEAPGKFAYRISVNWEAHEQGKDFSDLFAPLVEDPGVHDLTALVIGDWGGTGQGNDAAPVVEALVAASERLANLRALFLGEMTYEESEISWINQTDVGPLFTGFPQLIEMWIRGGNGLSLGRPRHDRLRKLVIETGGLPGSVVREVATAHLPELEHLELWLGDPGYGRNVTEDDLRPILAGGLFPKLKYLGLRNDTEADATAVLLARSPIVGQLEVLDLSLGALGDQGAAALVNCQALKNVQSLHIRRHYVSEAIVRQLQRCGPEVDASDRQEPDKWDGKEHRYCSVSE